MNPCTVIGIDPGLSGAIAVLDTAGALLRVEDMPVVSKAGGGKEVAAPVLASLLREYAGAEDVLAVLEQVASRPGQGVAGMFAFGDSFGVVRGVLGALGIAVTRITPTVWKRAAKLTGAPKDRARTLAIERWPARAEWFSRKKDVGRADAALLALHGVNTARRG